MINFTLPNELIAQQPARPRDAARLLVYEKKTQAITDTVFSKLPEFLHKDTAIVLNNSKVENCRWLFHDGRVEIFVLEKLDTHTLRALVRPGKKFKLGANVDVFDWLSIEVVAVDDEGIRTMKLSVAHDDERLRVYEHVPLPPYIEQNDELANEYQTVYAKPLGSKAAPTAGLHFTDTLLQEIAEKHTIHEVTLHVGLGTFASLTEAHMKAGTLHKEHYEIAPHIAKALTQAKHIMAVGTTSARTLESWATTHKLTDATDIFIQPG